MSTNKNNALHYIHQYLTETGWGYSQEITDEQCLYRTDPLTGMAVRGDHAFQIQTERDIYELFLDKYNEEVVDLRAKQVVLQGYHESHPWTPADAKAESTRLEEIVKQELELIQKNPIDIL